MPYKRVNPVDDARAVLGAVQRGHYTFKAIRRETNCTADRISEALALLLLRANVIRTEKRNGVRLYLPVGNPGLRPRRSLAPRPEPALSFSEIRRLMPKQPTIRNGEVNEYGD